MLVLDLRWVLFGILILGFAITGLIVWLLSRFDLAQRTLLPFPAEAQPIFARAPFGLVLLDDPLDVTSRVEAAVWAKEQGIVP